MSRQAILSTEPAGGGLGEAEASVAEACALLVRADLAGLEQAAGHLSRASGILSGWPVATGEPSPRRLALHRSIERAGHLLAAVGGWCEHRRTVLFPEETMPPCYRSDGREAAATTAGTMTLEG